MVLMIISGNHIYMFTRDPCDIDLSSSASKINRGRILAKINEYVKFSSSVINCSQENKQIPFFYKRDACDIDI